MKGDEREDKEGRNQNVIFRKKRIKITAATREKRNRTKRGGGGDYNDGATTRVMELREADVGTKTPYHRETP